MGLECMVVACLNCRAQAKHTSSQNFQNAFFFVYSISQQGFLF